MKFYKFWHWYGRWHWAVGIDRGGFTLLTGPFEMWVVWEKDW